MIFWHRNHQLGYTFCGALPLLEGRSEVIFDEGSGEPSLLEGLRGHEFTRYEREPDTFLDKIVTMDKSAVAYHTPETKEQSKQLVKKGFPGTIKCKTQASRVKQMVLAFHNSKGLIYTNLVPRGTTVKADYIMGALKQFLRQIRLKRPQMVEEGLILH